MWYFYVCTISVLLDYFIAIVLLVYNLSLLSPSSLHFAFNLCSCLQLQKISDVPIQSILLQLVHPQSHSVQIDLLQGDEIESVLFCSHWLDLSLILRPSFSTLLTSLSCLIYSSTMKTEAVDSSETMVNLYQNTTRQISKRGNINNHRCGNLICYRVYNRQIHSYKMEVLILNFHLCECGVSNDDFSI